MRDNDIILPKRPSIKLDENVNQRINDIEMKQTNDNPYECSRCGKAFSVTPAERIWILNLGLHNVTPILCKTCRGFATNESWISLASVEALQANRTVGENLQGEYQEETEYIKWKKRLTTFR